MPRGKAATTGSGTTIVISGQRKQNIACDQCRHRKIRCLRADKTEVCQQCLHKKTQCTSIYIDSLEQAKCAKDTKPKTQTQIQKSSTIPPETEEDTPPKKKRKRSSESESLINASSSSKQNALELSTSNASGETDHWNVSGLSTYSFGQSSVMAMAMAHNDTAHGGEVDPLCDNHLNLDLYSTLCPTQSSIAPPNEPSLPLPLSAEDMQHNFLRYLFSPYPILTPQFGYTDLSSIATCESGVDGEVLYEEDKGALWTEQPSQVHVSLADYHLEELANQFLETYLTMVNLRTPIHSPSEIDYRFHSPDTHIQGPLPHTLIAVMLAWGARFSTSNIIVQDREELSARAAELSGSPGTLIDQKGSRIVRLLIVRAREIVETSKIYRIPSLENAQTLFLLEGLLGEEIYRGKRHQGFYANCAMQQARALTQNGDSRSEISLLVRHLSMSGGVRSLAFGTRTLFDKVEDVEDVSKLAATVCSWSDEHQVQRSPAYTAIWLYSQPRYVDLCQQIHQLRSQPQQSNLEQVVNHMYSWRKDFLFLLGAPETRPDDRDFTSTADASTIDILYHYLWLFILRTVDRDEYQNVNQNRDEEDVIIQKVRSEAESAACRIAALVASLTENEYIRLDPLILYHPIIEAGKYLAKRGRFEFIGCLIGLHQYAITYPAVFEKAEELRLIYESNLSNNGTNSKLDNNGDSNDHDDDDDSEEMSQTISKTESTLDETTPSASLFTVY